MRKHAQSILKLVCLILAALVLSQLIAITRRINPLHNVTVPQLPTLTAKTGSTNTANGSTPSQPAMNAMPPGNSAKTNNASLPATATNHVDTNLVAAMPNTNSTTTNSVVKTNFSTVVKIAKTETNPIVKLPTNSTNTASIKTPATAATNSTPSNGTMPARDMIAASGHMPMMNRGGRMGFNPGGQRANLPPAIQAQVDKIFNSEIFGPIPHPMPMALMGIAGDVAFLRTPDGQSGMVKLGDSLGEIKLVRIGINRVLVEQDGQKKELTIFDGYGSESLLDKQGGTNNETHE